MNEENCIDAYTDIHKVLKNWTVVNDIASREWYIEAYVGGEDGTICEGPYDSEVDAITAKMKANRDGIEYNARYYYG